MAPQPYESWRVYIGFTPDPTDRMAPLTDVTSYVDGDVQVRRGKSSSERSTVSNGTAGFALRNPDQRFTPGNPESPYAPWVLSGRRLVITDVLEDEEVALFDGFIEFPDIDDWKKSSATAPRDQGVAVSGLDRLAWLDASPAMVSTLAEHVKEAAGDTLVVFVPGGERAAPLLDTVSGRRADVVTGVQYVQFGATQGVRGDDLRAPRIAPIQDLALATPRSYLEMDISTAVATGQSVSLSAWVLADALPETSPPAEESVLTMFGDVGSLRVANNLSTGIYAVGGPYGATATASAGRVLERGQWRLITARISLPAATVELWIGADVAVTATMPGVPTLIDFDTLQFGGPSWYGSIYQIGVHVGAGAFTRAQHLAQYAAGWDGLDRQRCDDRIRTLASYAGLPADDLLLDKASALMARAQLAGRSVGEAMRTAADTDNGLLFCAGDGKIAFQSRSRRYNPPPTAPIDISWLEPALRWRTDPPITVADVSTSTGTAGHAVNPAAVTEWTERGATANLDTACDADAQNLAQFLTRELGFPRHHPAQVAFQLRATTPMDRRKRILRAQIGDRIPLSGLPSTAPAGGTAWHIEGITHVLNTAGHRVEWTPGPILGDVPDVVQPYPKVGQASVRTETRIPF